ncbi:MAG: hypothetical protein SFV81_01345 [Pirellulaceae bacterium]|nr:hypothetical protein [Pirellulaceae bacterium]
MTNANRLHGLQADLLNGVLETGLMNESLFSKLIYKATSSLRLTSSDSPRELFQLRFFLSACLLAIGVGMLSLVCGIASGQYLASIFISFFVTGLLLHLLAARLGFRAKPLMWSLLSLVTVFLIVISLVTREIDTSQLCWLILIPLTTRAFSAPRVEDDQPQPSSRVTFIASVLSVCSALLIVMLHDLGLTFDQPRLPEPAWLVASNYVLFLASVMGLVLLYDFSARMMIEELQRVRQLLSICAWCRKIKSEHEWISLEEYTKMHTGSDLSHGICPDCRESEYRKAGL